MGQIDGGVRIGATTPIVLGPGTVLAGYRIGEVIGIGGMAIVYRAEQLALRRDVALKVLSPDLTQDDVFRERFRREAKLVAGLEHPNIVGIHDFGESDGRLFIAMRLVDGAPLSDRLRAGLSADNALGILRPVADALDAAHAAGLVHRDVKPQNILLAKTGRTYLVDFGVAKALQQHSLTATGGFIGSLNYASPEQIRGDRVTGAADVYALSALLFECMTGRVPYPRDTDAGILHAHLSAPPPTTPPSWPHALEFNALIDKGMAKSPSARYPTAGELLDAASALIGGMSPDERKVTPALAERPVPEAADEPSRPDDRPATQPETPSGPAGMPKASDLGLAAVAPPTRVTPSPSAPATSGGPSRRIVIRRRAVVLVAAVVAAISAGALVLLVGGGSAHRAARAGGTATRIARAGGSTTHVGLPGPPGPDAVTGRMLAKAGADMAIAREHARLTSVSTTSLGERARLARALASTYDAVIKTLSSATVSGHYRQRVTSFVSALRSDRDALKSLAAAAENHQQASYESAKGSIQTAELALADSARKIRAALILIPPLQPMGIAPYNG